MALAPDAPDPARFAAIGDAMCICQISAQRWSASFDGPIGCARTADHRLEGRRYRGRPALDTF
jgi:hypothetical protein